MKTTTSTTRYNQATNLFQNLSFFKMIFCIYRQLFCKGPFIIGKNNLFFGMCSSVPFTSRSLDCAVFPRKFFLFFLPLGKNISQNTKVYCLEYLACIFNNWLLKVVLQRYFYHWEEQPFLLYVFFSNFCSHKSSLYWFPWKILPVISSPGKCCSWENQNTFWNTKCLF